MDHARSFEISAMMDFARYLWRTWCVDHARSFEISAMMDFARYLWRTWCVDHASDLAYEILQDHGSAYCFKILQEFFLGNF